MDADWPFSDPPETEVIVLDRILDGEAPILLVTRDEDEPTWQFLDGEHVFEDDARLVLLGEIVQIDPSVLDLGPLPIGWYAWRAKSGLPWRVAPGEPPAVLPEVEDNA